MRRIVRAYIAAAIDRETPHFELLRVSITAESRLRGDIACGVRTVAVPEASLGRRTIAVDVQLDAFGTVWA